MRESVRLATAAALLLVVLSSCATAPASTDTAAGGVPAPCHGAYVSDVDTRATGEATPGAAAVAWAKSVLAPSGAPPDGWKAVDERTLRSGDWIVGVARTVSGGWLVDGLGCGSPQS